MASSGLPRGRGQGRSRQPVHPVGVSLIDIPTSTTPKVTDAIQTYADASPSSDDLQLPLVSQTTATSGRGRGRRPKTEPPEPRWTVSDLTLNQFMSNDRPLKPTELGKVGQEIEVMVNYFPIRQFPRQGLVYQYEIKIENKRNSKLPRVRRRIVYECWLKNFCRKYLAIDRYKIVFDNEAMVLTYDQILPDMNEIVVGPNRENRQEEYRVSIKRVGNPVDLNMLNSLKEFYQMKSDDNIPLKTLQNIKQVLSIVLHEGCSSRADFIYNRSFFAQPDLQDKYGEWDLGSGTALWRGFYSCLVFAKGTHQLLMNLDVSHGVFMKKQPFLDFLREVMLHSVCGKWQYGRESRIKKAEIEDVLKFLDPVNNHDYYEQELEFLLKHCKFLRVRSNTANNSCVHEVHGLGKAASTQTFKWKLKDNNFVTVQEFFTVHYNIILKYPSLPTLMTRNGAFVPMELVDVEPIKMKRITDEQRALLCQKSSLKPHQYCDSIKQIRQNPKQQSFEDDPFINAWNFNIDVEMIKIPARILPMPTVIFTDTYKITRQRVKTPGVWSSTTTRFHTPTKFPSVWAMINLSSSLNQHMCEAFYNQLKEVAGQRGINFPPPLIYKEYKVQRETIDRMLNELKQLMAQNEDCKFLIVILPKDDGIRDKTYGDLKKLCELELGFGIVTQMVKATNAVKSIKNRKEQWDYSKMHNILLKINTKLDGINSVLQVDGTIERFFSKGHQIMYVGVDISHAASGSSRRRSAVAVVASADDIPNRYFKEVYMQERPPSVKGESWEYIKDMKEIMKSVIRQYDTYRGYPPKAIVIYRDGISSSEFDSVFEKELTATRQACADLSPVYRPCLTYIVVNKRHHTRLFPGDSGGNVVAGTVVDSPDITDPTTYDFYLNSHYGQLGTSRPTHYRVLYDDNKLKPDEAHMLTYALCHTYARCTRSVSIPAPVKYADLLAFRAGFYIDINEELNGESSVPINEDVDVNNTIKSKRIVLSSKLRADSPFFL